MNLIGTYYIVQIRTIGSQRVHQMTFNRREVFYGENEEQLQQCCQT